MSLINMTNKDGVTLKTAGKYCAEDITVVPTFKTEPKLQEKTVTQNGVYFPDSGYDGLFKVTVSVPPESGDGITTSAKAYKCSAAAASTTLHSITTSANSSIYTT